MYTWENVKAFLKNLYLVWKTDTTILLKTEKLFSNLPCLQFLHKHFPFLPAVPQGLSPYCKKMPLIRWEKAVKKKPLYNLCITADVRANQKNDVRVV